jgi:hypothetical protein
MQREKAGDRQGAETLAQRAADAGDTNTLVQLAIRREEAGDPQGAEALARQHADAGGYSLIHGRHLRTLWPYGLDPDGAPSAPYP